MNIDQETLRPLVARISRDMGVFMHPTSVRDSSSRTLATLEYDWLALVAALDFPPIRRLRVCPECGHSGMADASRCGYCWRPLGAFPELRRIAELTSADRERVALHASELGDTLDRWNDDGGPHH